jgi:hypothetical protein
MYAFGLEETGDYPQAETRARAALHHDPGDTWANHALAHVFEMQGRQREGIAFLSESAKYWWTSFFAVHNWWHRALFHLDLGEVEETFSLYDGPIRGGRSAEWLNVIDAASLLWRLSLFGVGIGDRASRLAEDIEPQIGEPTYIFNDWHAVMAFGLAGHHERNEQILTDNRHRAVGTNQAMVEQSGLALIDGFSSFAAGRYSRAVDLLTKARPWVATVGGSHAQRDIVDLTLIVAEARAGKGCTARTLIAERVAHRPASGPVAHELLKANGL